MENPYAILGLAPGASDREIALAYRALAKRLHPDLSGDGPAATAQMAELNAAHDAVRKHGAVLRPVAASPERGGARQDPLRSALGDELLGVLEADEPVTLVVPVTTWASPRAVLALSDRRLLWLLDDAVSNRVRWLRLRDVCAADFTLNWPRRRSATLRVRARDGRRHTFSNLRPALAARLAHHLEGPAA